MTRSTASAGANDRAAHMAAEVRAQEKKVERLVETLASVGVSEAVTKRLRAEEAKLVELRGKLAAAVPTGRPKPPPAIDTEALVADLRSLRTLTAHDPAEARDRFHRIVESVVLRPVGAEYEATLAFRNSTAAIAGGRVGDKSGCGGGVWSKADLLTFTPALCPGRRG